MLGNAQKLQGRRMEVILFQCSRKEKPKTGIADVKNATPFLR
jgi:hypothetical protein